MFGHVVFFFFFFLQGVVLIGECVKLRLDFPRNLTLNIRDFIVGLECISSRVFGCQDHGHPDKTLWLAELILPYG